MAVVGSVLLVTFAGVALADIITCDGGRCEGTNRNDEITGSDLRDRIFALGGFDEVFAGAGEDDLNGGSSADNLDGQADNDTYIGGGGNDFLTEVYYGSGTGDDEMNGGGGVDYMEGGLGNDILRGQEGDDNSIGALFPSMYGNGGDDELYGGPGEDGLEGDQGTDEHYGGRDNDFIDAVSGDELGTQDLVDCGGGFDTAVVREPEDIVRDNCEDVTEESTIAADTGTADEEQRQQAAEAFLAGRGG